MSDVDVAGVLVDLDGTVYRGDQLIPGARKAIQWLRESGVRLVFLTNKAIERRADYSDKLTELGIPTPPSEIVTSGTMTATFLATHHPTDPVFVVGESALREELRDRDLTITEDPAEAEILLVSMDRGFDYDDLTAALYALDEETGFIATNPDRTCPIANGEIPDCAAMVGAIEGATGRDLERVIGKPSQTAIDAALSRLEEAPERCVLIGDRLETDIAMGKRAGMRTILVLSGVTDVETTETSSIRPDHVIESIADVQGVL